MMDARRPSPRPVVQGEGTAPNRQEVQHVSDSMGAGPKLGPTLEEVRRVREHECRTHGHSFDEVLTLERLDPLGLVCVRCGRTWPVGEGTGGAG
jgi:hypothetical protein